MSLAGWRVRKWRANMSARAGRNHSIHRCGERRSRDRVSIRWKCFPGLLLTRPRLSISSAPLPLRFRTIFNGDVGRLVEFFNHPAPPPPPPGCTFTLGFWKNHTSAWPSGYDPNDSFFLSGTTWLGALSRRRRAMRTTSCRSSTSRRSSMAPAAPACRRTSRPPSTVRRHTSQPTLRLRRRAAPSGPSSSPGQTRWTAITRLDRPRPLRYHRAHLIAGRRPSSQDGAQTGPVRFFGPRSTSARIRISFRAPEARARGASPAMSIWALPQRLIDVPSRFTSIGRKP